ncbi:hypothetical protein BKA70DRAFT_119782 [Coprinopsis sp. MPI-PUGE-AT-0042]|nr:hypothetical protein BKA70DRAFT_119782 [Coprinopsis sp. MPI-PUGE-AT-0042]
MADDDTITSKVPLKDDEFYWESITFQVEDALFKVPKRHLVDGSTHFSATYGLLDSNLSDFQTSGPSNAHTLQANPVPLLDVAAEEFRSFLKVMYTGGLHSRMKLTKDEWLSVLKLSTRWYFADLRRLSAARLAALDLPPTEKVSLGKQFHLSQWVLAGYDSLVRQEGVIPFEDAKQIGWESAVVLYMCREQRLYEKDTNYLQVAFKEELDAMAEQERRLAYDGGVDVDEMDVDAPEDQVISGAPVRPRRPRRILVEAQVQTAGLEAHVTEKLLQTQAQLETERAAYSETIAGYKQMLEAAKEADQVHADKLRASEVQLAKLEEQVDRRRRQAEDLESKNEELQKALVKAAEGPNVTQEEHLNALAKVQEALSESQSSWRKEKQEREHLVGRCALLEEDMRRQISNSGSILSREKQERQKMATEHYKVVEKLTSESSDAKTQLETERRTWSALLTDHRAQLARQKADLEQKATELDAVRRQLKEAQSSLKVEASSHGQAPSSKQVAQDSEDMPFTTRHFPPIPSSSESDSNTPGDEANASLPVSTAARKRTSSHPPNRGIPKKPRTSKS